jgi:hypothetical protein
LVTEWKIVKRVEEQFNAFMSGFNELIPPDLVNVFDERELELLIGGIADIDVDDWKKHTDYRGYQEQDEVIQNFWKIVRTWDAEQKSRLLQFTTGTSRIPVNGFKDLQGSDGPRRFTIEKSGDPNALPKSHTWYVSQILQPPTFTNSLSALTVWIFRLTRPMMPLSTRCPLQWRKLLDLDRNRCPSSSVTKMQRIPWNPLLELSSSNSLLPKHLMLLSHHAHPHIHLSFHTSIVHVYCNGGAIHPELISFYSIVASPGP